MRRQIQILCIAGAAVVAGGTLWAIAGSDMLGRFGLSSSSPTNEASIAPRSANGERVAAVSTPKAAVPAGARRSDPLAIEIARIEAGGASVIAGRSPPNHRVIVLANGREVATAVATDEGQWSVIVSEGIAAGPLELSVSAKPASGGPAVVSTPQHLVVPQPGNAAQSVAESAGRAPSQSQPSPRPQPRVAEAPPVKAWAPSMLSGTPAVKSTPAKAASAPAERSPSAVQARAPVPVPTQTPAQSTAKAQNPNAENRADTAADKRALEQFAALVERARTDAAAATRESPGSNAPTAGSPASGPATVSTPVPPAAPATATSDASIPAPAAAAPVIAMRVGAAGARSDAEQVPIPVPITFVTDETELTTDGARAAALLAEYLRLKRPEGISLSGHADSRGPDGYNMDLSKRRLEAIEQYLRKAGYAGNLSLIPKGKREPYLGIDRTKLSLQDVYQADRRVELRLTQ
jgi:outer membrane protein OmpA-like peptidoglycan-associated protein